MAIQFTQAGIDDPLHQPGDLLRVRHSPLRWSCDSSFLCLSCREEDVEVSEMIERVAKAIFLSRATMLPLARWDDLTAASHEWYIRQASVAIEAMREPTDAIKAMSMCNDFAERLWPAMIDAALSDPNTEVQK